MCLKALHSHWGLFFSLSTGLPTQSWHVQCECKRSCLERPRSLANKPGVSHKAEVGGSVSLTAHSPSPLGMQLPDGSCRTEWLRGMGGGGNVLPFPTSSSFPSLPLCPLPIARSAPCTNPSYLCPGNETLTFKAGYCSFLREMYF